jgi:uncharacterized membrane protein YhfC
MLYIPYILKILVLVSIPIALGVYLVRKYDLEAKWWWVGALVFALSQAIQSPLQKNAVIPYINSLGISGTLSPYIVLIVGVLLVGLCVGAVEEVLRYSAFRWLVKDARYFQSGVLLGAGSGGAGSLYLGFQVLAYYTDISYYSLPVVVSQILMIVVEICLSVMVVRSLVQKRWIWFLAALGFHAALESIRLMMLNLTNEIVAACVVALFVLFSLLILNKLFQQMTTSLP